MSAPVVRFQVALSDVERGLFEELDLRLARHPSETNAYLTLRVLAACLLWDARLAFAPGGISDKERPALFVEDTSGRLPLWVEIGAPSVDRLEKARKKADRVVVVTTDGPRVAQTAAKAKATVEVVALDRRAVDEIAAHVDERQVTWQVTVTDALLYVGDGARTVELAYDKQVASPS